MSRVKLEKVNFVDCDSVASRTEVMFNGCEGELEVLLVGTAEWWLVHWHYAEEGSQGVLIDRFFSEAQAISYYLAMQMGVSPEDAIAIGGV